MIKNNRYYQAVLPVFNFISNLERNEIQEMQKLELECQEAFQQFNELAPQDFFVSDVQYALEAFVDEKILNKNQNFKNFWAGRTLQLSSYGDQLAGERFFEKIEILERGNNSLHMDVLFVYYLCLELGFVGKYSRDSKEDLKFVKKKLKDKFIGFDEKNNAAQNKETAVWIRKMDVTLQLTLLTSCLMSFILYLMLCLKLKF